MSILNLIDMMASWFLVLVSGGFLLAIIARTWTIRSLARDPLTLPADTERETPNTPTEPIVLLGLGFTFLFINYRLVPVFALVTMERLNVLTGGHVKYPIIQSVFALASVALIATIAKSFWTHLRLEEGNWGPVVDYRKSIWTSRCASFFDFTFRCLIAIIVVLLQKKISQLGNIANIKEFISNRYLSEIQRPQVVVDYNHWLAGISFLAIVLFSIIFTWSLIAFHYNKQKIENAREARRGTLWFAIPGLILSICLQYIATGSIIPDGEVRGDASVEFIYLSSGIMLVMAILIFINLISTLISIKKIYLDFVPILIKGTRNRVVALHHWVESVSVWFSSATKRCRPESIE